MLRVSWTAKKTNEWVLNKAGVKTELLDTVKARKLAYSCLLYTSDAADDSLRVDLGGRRIIKKKFFCVCQ